MVPDHVLNKAFEEVTEKLPEREFASLFVHRSKEKAEAVAMAMIQPRTWYTAFGVLLTKDNFHRGIMIEVYERMTNEEVEDIMQHFFPGKTEKQIKKIFKRRRAAEFQEALKFSQMFFEELNI